MRLILTILLIGLFKADAQMVINASSPYRFLGIPIIDTNFVAGFSLRKIKSNYTGNAIRVRKDTTGQPEQDIGFTANGDLDTAALKNFLNARSGFITTWYDQSGRSPARNATQTTQARQPRIALLGVIDRRNTRPTIDFIGNNFLQVTDYSLSSEWYVFAVIRPNSTSATQRSIYAQDAGGVIGKIYVGYGRSSRQFLTWNNQYLSNATNIVSTNLELQTFFKTGGAGNNWTYGYFTNGVANGSFNINLATPTTTQNHTIGSFGTSTINIDAKLSELIIYASDISSVRNNIDININTYYTIW